MRRVIPLISKSLSKQTPEEYHAHVKSLYVRPPGSTPVNGVKIVFGKKVTQVRFGKDMPKRITKKQIKMLADFYEKTEQEITELMQKRKVEIV